MTPMIILDSGPLGMIINPRAKSPKTLACQAWFIQRAQAGYEMVIPEIVDYEVRRELLLRRNVAAIHQLELLKKEIIYLPITTEAMLLASQLWSEVRRSGQPTSDSKALDGDVILAAQVMSSIDPSFNPIVATTNVAHIERFIPAQLWETIG